MMNGLGVSLVFDPPDWPVLLLCAAIAALAWELRAVIIRLRSRSEAAGFYGQALAALLAPIFAAPAATFVALTGEGPWRTRPGATLSAASSRMLGVYVLLAISIAYRPGGAVLAVGACGVAWAIRAYRTTTAPISPPARHRLLMLRLLALGLLTLWAMGVGLERRTVREIPTAVLIGLDVSRSMQRRDVQDRPDSEPISRFQAARQALWSCREELETLAQRAELAWFAFSDSTQSLSAKPDVSPVPDWPKAEGSASALGDATAAAFDPFAVSGRQVAAIVLISDGCNNTSEVISPERVAVLMGSRNVPIYTVVVGSETPLASLHSLAVKSLSAPDEIDAYHRLSASAVIEAIGLEGREVNVVCKFDDRVLSQQTFTVEGSRQKRVVRFSHTPLEAGFHRLTVSVSPTDGRDGGISGQRVKSRLIHVRDRELRILYVEGKLRYEGKYVARAFGGARRFSVDRRILTGPASSSGGLDLGGDIEQWLPYHAIILGDVPASRFTAAQLNILRELVGKYGKGLCMLGGANSFADGGWAGTPVADVLGVDVATSAGQVDREIRIVPSAAGQKNEIMRIDEQEDVSAGWAKLRTLSGANRLGTIKPAAIVLARTDDGLAMIVAQRYGNGRSLAVAFDTTWRWVLSSDDTGELQRKFWRQVALYLAEPKGHAWITTSRTSYDLDRLLRGQDVIEVSAGMEDAAGRAVNEAEMTVELACPDGNSIAIQLEPNEKAWAGQLAVMNQPGLYELTLAARVNQIPLSARHQFEVVRRDLEALDVLANRELLRRMASDSDGAHGSLATLKDLLRLIEVRAKPHREVSYVHWNFAEKLRWPVAIAVIFLLCVEWASRKRAGLI